MDLLSEILHTFRIRGGVFLDAAFCADWWMSSQVDPAVCAPVIDRHARVMAVHQVVQGRVLLEHHPALPPVELVAGDVVFLLDNPLHRIGTDPGRLPTRAGDHLVLVPGSHVARIRSGPGAPSSRVLCGFLGAPGFDHPLFAHIPRILVLSADASPLAQYLRQALVSATESVRGDGKDAMLGRLIELCFVEALRQQALHGGSHGWLQALADPVVGKALSLLHERQADDWTVERLAREVGVSRTVMAERFASAVGMPPMGYLGEWRLQLAASDLRSGHASVEQAATRIGYRSAAAFSRAFKRKFGVSPQRWRTGEG